jgi:hypothetical protein
VRFSLFSSAFVSLSGALGLARGSRRADVPSDFSL